MVILVKYPNIINIISNRFSFIQRNLKNVQLLQAQYIYDTYGRFSAVVQNVFSFLYLQVQHLDLDFVDHYFKPSAYLTTHKEHMKMAQNPTE